MNLITYNRYPKSKEKIIERVLDGIKSCKNISQIAGSLSFNMEYISAIGYFETQPPHKSTDYHIEKYLKKKSRHKNKALKGEGK